MDSLFSIVHETAEILSFVFVQQGVATCSNFTQNQYCQTFHKFPVRNIKHRYFSHICYDLAALYAVLLALQSSINFNAPLNFQKMYFTLANTKFLFKCFAYCLHKVTLDSSGLSVGNTCTLTPTGRSLLKVHVNLSSLSDFGYNRTFLHNWRL